MKTGSMDSFEQLTTEISPSAHNQSSSMSKLRGQPDQSLVQSHSQSSSSSSQMGLGGIVDARKAHSRQLEIDNAALRAENARLREEQTRLQQPSSTSQMRLEKTKIRQNVLKDVIAASKRAEDNQVGNDDVDGSGSGGPLGLDGMGMTSMGVGSGCSYEAENRDHKAKMRKVTPYKEG